VEAKLAQHHTKGLPTLAGFQRDFLAGVALNVITQQNGRKEAKRQQECDVPR
jgi:hypothetical protein